MKKLVITSIFMFSFGFLTHAFFFPDFLANGFTDVSQIVIPNSSPTPAASGEKASSETKITYKNGRFNKHNIVMPLGSYLSITNISSDHPMWLISNDPDLATVRGYGESEQVRKRMDESGQFAVADKNNSSEKIVITVKLLY